jgi:hypothetical protein
VAALAGFFIAYFEGRLSRSVGVRAETERGGRRHSGARGAVLLGLMGVLLWEYRVAPLPHELADPAADPVDVWLARQPEDFAVVHVPIGTGRNAWTETEYMLGSTLHWKALVNGYARNVPTAYRYLTATPPLGAEFMRRLRAGFPVRYLLVHEDRLAGRDQRARLRGLLSHGDDAVFVDQFGYTFVFAMPHEGTGPPAGTDEAQPPFDFAFRREVGIEELSGKRGIELEVRGSQLAVEREVIAVAGWNEQRTVARMSDTWERVRTDFPEGHVDTLGDDVGAFELDAYTLVPVGETGAQVAAEFTIDAQQQEVALGLRDRVFHESAGPALVAHRLEEFGTGLVETRTFSPTAAGAADLRGYLTSIPAGTLVAFSARFVPSRRMDDDAREALRLIGVEVQAGEEVSIMVALGRRGAAPGTALRDAHHVHAFIDLEGWPTPVFQVRNFSLF